MKRLTHCLISPPFFSHVITNGEFYITMVLNNFGVKGAIMIMFVLRCLGSYLLSVNAQLTLLMLSFS